MQDTTHSISSEEQIKTISFHFSKIMEALGLDITNTSLHQTPLRVAKMYVNELFLGLDPNNFPRVTTFPHIEDGRANEIITIEKIRVHSVCEHHFLPFIGYATIQYIPMGKLIGLSKIHRIVNYFSRRPQLQEKLTNQIAHSLSEHIVTDHVRVEIYAKHYCVVMRGPNDLNSYTKTVCNLGLFSEKL